jgi:succinyl-CoA synthetase alpha subunit
VPVHDTAYAWAYAVKAGNATRIIGPNCPGIISPGKSNAGIIPADITGPGRVGLVSKSGTLTYQMMYELRDLGFSTAIGIGGDPIIGTTHIGALAAFESDPETEARISQHRGVLRGVAVDHVSGLLGGGQAGPGGRV